MCGVMVWEMISQDQAQGTPIAIKPNFNYMVRPARIRFHVLECRYSFRLPNLVLTKFARSTTWISQIGPSSGVLISDGARFVPCIKRVPDLVSIAFEGFLRDCR
jgi:hypothetical protein